MLAELRIRDLGVIDDAHLEVSTGLNVLTGETGAGKTMVVDALSLLLGERADPGAVRVGRPEALVEGRLQAEVGEAAAALAAAGVTAEARERAHEADVLRYQLDEINAAEVRPGESAELAAEAERLTNAEALQQAAAVAHQLLGGDDDTGAATALGAAARALAGPGGHDPALAELAGRSQALAAEVGDLASGLRAYAEGVLVDPGRLDEVQARIALLRDLERKYGDGEAAVLAFADRAAGRLAELEGGVLRSGALEAEAAELRRTLAGLGAALTARRREAADRLADAVRAELADLAMPHAKVRVVVEQDEDEGGLEVDGRHLAGGDDGLDRV